MKGARKIIYNYFFIMAEGSKHDQGEPIVQETSRVEHLAEGFRPIMACIGTYAQYGDQIWKLKPELAKSGHNVNYYKRFSPGEKEDLKNDGPQTYAISSVDGKPKFTEKLINCTSLVAVGREAGSNVELSFLTHQDPDKFHRKSKLPFERDLGVALQELRDKCLPGSIDVAITGGHYHEGDSDGYKKSMAIVGSVVQEIMGFSPTVIVGPKDGGEDDVYFDTSNRRLFVVRKGAHHEFNEPFMASEVKNMTGKWDKQRKNKIR